MFLQLGDYLFEGIKLPQSWNESTETNYVEVPIINGKPVLQKTGEKLVEHDITVELRDEFCSPVDEYNALQLYRRNGNVLQLSGGDGTNYGRYVITSINRVQLRASGDGYVSAMQLAIHLKEYNTTKTTVEETGTALKSNSPVEEPPLEPMPSLAAALSNDIEVGVSASNEISKSTKRGFPNFQKIKNLANKALAAYKAANAKIAEAEKIVYRAKQLKQTVESCIQAVEAIKQAADIHDFDSLMQANDNLEVGVYHMKGAAAPVAAFVGSREGGK